MTAINKFFDWVSRIALLNVLWIVFTVLGLGFLGLFPATAATFAIARKWVSGEADIPVVKTFWNFYKRDFTKSNLLGYLLSVISYILYLDFVFLTVSPSDVVYFLTIPFMLIAFIFTLTLLYTFPVFVYYDMKLFQVLKSAFFMMLLNPLQTLIMFIGCSGIIVILWTFQGLAIFFGPAILAIVIMMPAYRAFQKVKDKNMLEFENSSTENG
jgi:uncharacterized membrane protein YesL